MLQSCQLWAWDEAKHNSINVSTTYSAFRNTLTQLLTTACMIADVIGLDQYGHNHRRISGKIWRWQYKDDNVIHWHTIIIALRMTHKQCLDKPVLTCYDIQCGLINSVYFCAWSVITAYCSIVHVSSNSHTELWSITIVCNSNAPSYYRSTITISSCTSTIWGIKQTVP